MTTAGNGPSCSGCVTNVSIRPDGVSISTKRSSMVPVTLCRRGRQRQDGGRPLVLAWRRISLSSRSEEHTSELQSLAYLVCRLLLEKKKKIKINTINM